MAVSYWHQATRCSLMSRRRYSGLLAYLAILFASLSVTESQCNISPSNIYARVGDQAIFSCSHTSSAVFPDGFSLNGFLYQTHSSFPGYQANTYADGVFTMNFTRTVEFSEPSLITCLYSQCITREAIIRVPDPPSAVDIQSIIVQPSLTSVAISWSMAAPFPGYPITHYNIELLSGSTVFSSTTNMTSITIPNLAANQEYNFNIVTVSDSGNSVPTSKIVTTAPLGTVTSPGTKVDALLDGARTLMWSFTLDQAVTATPSILINDIRYSLEELSEMGGVSVQESATMTAIVLTDVGVERNGSRWQWMLEELGGSLQSDETMLFVQGPPLAPPSPTYSAVGPTSGVLTLSGPPFSHLPITVYIIEYNSRLTPDIVTTLTVPPGTVQVMLDNVQQDQSYTVTVYASNVAGRSEGTSFLISSRVVTPDLLTCPSETDPYWMLMWSTRLEGQTQSQFCIPMQEDSGQATRQCGEGGDWDDPDVWSCRTPGFSQVLQQAPSISDRSCYNEPIVDCLQNIYSFINLLMELINSSNVIFPNDLEVTAVALQNSTRLQESAITQGIDVSLPLGNESVLEQYLQIYDAIFSDTHSVGWALLLEENDTFAGDYLLQSFQSLAMILANETGAVDSYIHDNFEVRIVPVVGEVSLTLSNGVMVQVTGVDVEGTNVVAGTVEHVATVLPRLWPSGITSAESNSVLVIVEPSVIDYETVENFAPSVTVTFQFDELLYRPRCARWDYSLNSVRSQVRGAWSTEGVETVSDKWSTQVVCRSNAFGPITVLTDIQGPALDFSAAPVSIAFYTGSVLGVIFLCFSLAPLIIFTYQDSKADDRRPILNVSQLNYTIVAMVTIVILTVGIETGRNADTSSTYVSVGCKVTAALLHYSFLTLFMWMFCTILVAFCLHAEVGRGLVKRWWSILILAYVPAVVVVAIASPIAHPYYGSELGCWLSAQRGTHWAFFVPAIVIALATVVLLVLVMVSVVRNKTEDAATDEDQELLTRRRELIGAIVVYTFVHFPCLCLTWLFGFLYLGTGNAAFAYVYAVLLTLQTAVFASFQMLRVRRIRRFWTETVYTRLKLNLSAVQRQPTAPPSVANPRALTGRYNADGRLIGGVSVLNSTDESPFGAEDTGTTRTDETYLYMW